MNQGAEPSPTWTLSVGARNGFYLNIFQILLVQRAGRKCGGCMDFNSGLARLRNCRGTAILPLDVGLLSTSDPGAALVGLQDPLLPHPDVLFGLAHQYARVPPSHRMGADVRLVEAWADAAAGREHCLRSSIDNAVVPELRRPRNRRGLAFRIVRRVQRRIE